MSNLIKYIKDNNKTYNEYPFNEVDACVYACLSYIDISGVFIPGISIYEAYTLMQNRFTLKVHDKFNEENRLLFKEIANSIRYKNNIITSFKKVINKTTQFGAITIKAPHFKVIAFLGTQDELVGWEEDFKMAYMYPIPAQREAINYLKENIKVNDYKVFVVGHSKGGNLAMSSSMAQDAYKRFKIKKIYNFDGPGFSDKIIDQNKLNKVSKKIEGYFPNESIVGMIFKQYGNKNIIRSQKRNVYQHDIHSWLIKDKTFIRGTLSNYSKKINNNFITLIDNYSIDNLEKFVSTIFSILYKSGYNYKSDLKRIDLDNIYNLLNEAKNLEEDEKKLLFNVFKTILGKK